MDDPGWVLELSSDELRERMTQRGWPEKDAALLVECSRAGCPECSGELIEALS